jgi:hypothetical protein
VVEAQSLPSARSFPPSPVASIYSSPGVRDEYVLASTDIVFPGLVSCKAGECRKPYPDTALATGRAIMIPQWTDDFIVRVCDGE